MAADANKAEAQTCMDRAREALKEGDAEKATRMLNKAKKLNPDQDINYLLKKAANLGTHAQQSSSSNRSEPSNDRSYAHDDHYEESDGLRSRHARHSMHVPSSQNLNANGSAAAARAKSRSRSAPRLGVDFTQKQVDLVARIRKGKDYYEILNVQKTASDDDIKKEYRKLALQLHPDKCRAPHATEAFKALGNAYAVLSNREKRQQYDMYGSASPSTRRRNQGDYFEYDYNRGFESEMTPEEIFNMFFGGGFPGDGGFQRRRGPVPRQHHHEGREDSPYTPFLQLFPLIAMLVLGLIAQFLVSDPTFSLHQNSKYTVRRETTELKVPYFVKPDFLQNYKGQLKRIENQVEDEYVQQLRMQCYKENNQKETMIYRARIYQDIDLLRRAQNLKMDACQRLEKLYGH
ncbi:unnamed protein product, partial [Mesorhabditis spiculigera]